MKKVLIVVILFLNTINLHAQLSYGIKGGLSIADIVLTNIINRDLESEYRMKAGIHAGIFAAIVLREKFSIDAELLYSSKGVKTFDSKINLEYITIPLLLRYNITPKFLAEGGAELGYLFSARSQYGNVSYVYNNNIDLGLDAGFVFNVTKKINAGLRYNVGLSSVIEPFSISSNNGVPNGDKIKYQNRVLQISLSYTIGKADLTF
jgi:hypothetical protein